MTMQYKHARPARYTGAIALTIGLFVSGVVVPAHAAKKPNILVIFNNNVSI